MGGDARRLRLGTRGSQLALWQAHWVAEQLEKSGAPVELVTITTSGDVARGPIGRAGAVGLFTKEIQRALLDGRVDLAVHSLKDLPTDRVPGLALAATPPRGAHHDVLVCARSGGWEQLPAGARIGTGSARRRAQLLHLRPDLEVLDIRGNVDTRLRKLDEGRYDAVVLAEAGLRRLGLEQRIAHPLPWRLVLPAAGQGALGVETRADDQEAAAALAPLDDPATRAGVTAERELLRALRAGCLAPVGAYGRMEDGVLRLDAAVLSGDGRERIAVSRCGPAEKAVELGRAAADQLLAAGAERLIAEVRQP